MLLTLWTFPSEAMVPGYIGIFASLYVPVHTTTNSNSSVLLCPLCSTVTDQPLHAVGPVIGLILVTVVFSWMLPSKSLCLT